MPTYVLRCANCDEQETTVPMSEAAEFMPCPVCERPRPQRFFAPHVQEDRLHFWKGPLGNGYSTALGAPMPSSRKERDRLAREKGVEFCTREELLNDSKEAAEAVAYKAHVDSGGERVLDKPAPSTDAFVPRPDWAKPLLG